MGASLKVVFPHCCGLHFFRAIGLFYHPPVLEVSLIGTPTGILYGLYFKIMNIIQNY
jgi:hypothetical protein